jgi:hypothetical protein
MGTTPGGLNSAAATIADSWQLIAGDHGIVVVSTLGDDCTIASPAVNAGVRPWTPSA